MNVVGAYLWQRKQVTCFLSFASVVDPARCVNCENLVLDQNVCGCNIPYIQSSGCNISTYSSTTLSRLNDNNSEEMCTQILETPCDFSAGGFFLICWARLRIAAISPLMHDQVTIDRSIRPFFTLLPAFRLYGHKMSRDRWVCRGTIARKELSKSLCDHWLRQQ